MPPMPPKANMEAGLGHYRSMIQIEVDVGDGRGEMTIFVIKASQAEEKYDVIGCPGHIDFAAFKRGGVIAEDLPSMEAAERAAEEWVEAEGWRGQVSKVFEWTSTSIGN